jgi:hypothetical protein
MLIQTWGEVFRASLQGLWLGIAGFLPNLIVAIIIFIVGWVVASVIGKALAQVITAIKIDKLFQSAGAEQVLNKAGLKLNVGKFIGELVKWFIVAVFLMASLEILGLTQVNEFLKEVIVRYLPQVIIAVLILVAATIFADLIGRIVTGSAKAANVKSANFLGSITRYAIWIFAFIIALSELGIAAQFMQVLFTGIIATLAIGAGLAFGLGGKDAAARAIENMKNEVKRD